MKPKGRRALLATVDYTLAKRALLAQVRYRHSPLAVRVRVEGEGRVRVAFDRPALAVAPGQAVVVYRGDEVVGGGWIDRPAGPDARS